MTTPAWLHPGAEAAEYSVGRGSNPTVNMVTVRNVGARFVTVLGSDRRYSIVGDKLVNRSGDTWSANWYLVSRDDPRVVRYVQDRKRRHLASAAAKCIESWVERGDDEYRLKAIAFLESGTPHSLRDNQPPACRHPKLGDGHCAQTGCSNYVSRCPVHVSLHSPLHAPAGTDDAVCTLDAVSRETGPEQASAPSSP